MFGIEFTPNQKIALGAILALSILGLVRCTVSRSPVGVAQDAVVVESSSEPGVALDSSDSDRFPLEADSAAASEVVCHVVGSVKTPGVYTLSAGQRVIDAIRAAGGPNADADMEALNLAAKVEDGTRIELPSLHDTRQRLVASAGMAAAKARGTRSSAGGSGKMSVPGEGVVHINTAGQDELQRLPGVGPATAEKIVEYRRTSGGFSRPEQIMDVKGIGPKKYEQMRAFVAL